MKGLYQLFFSLLLAFASSWACYFFGLHQGKLLEAGKRDAAVVKDMSTLLDSHKALVQRAAQVSQAMRAATWQRARQDAQTTQELTDVLQATAPVRADCVFDAGVLRQLEAARERAANAAANGIRATVPGTASGGQ